MPEETVKWLPPEQIRQIIDTVPEYSKHPERDRLLLETLWQTGARVTEVLLLTLGHIGQDSLVLLNEKQYKTVRVIGKSTKVHDKTAIKEVKINPQLCQALKDYCHEEKIIYPDEYVFQYHRGKHLYRQYVWRVLDKISQKLGIMVFGKHHIATGGRYKGVYPHMFRHSNGMKVLQDTGNIMLVKKRLGHSQVQSASTYARIQESDDTKYIEKAEW